MNKIEIDETKKLLAELIEEKEKEREEKEKKMKDERNDKIGLGGFFSFIFAVILEFIFLSGIWNFTTGFVAGVTVILWFFVILGLIFMKAYDSEIGE